ncbi:YbgA family protein [Acanthopleuribacter pedis]|uniref:DUF523 and DUF1722 domain-containing protein n=1 Tax=Acanthopleuribacter pedis TaxID=442870 RepID=A0A8J7QET0_9BACT|nr:DUF523 and DUF1722 domain-containing protein [Acanthopleuribacter pedis]MBO1322654.1 DUF523 and DUF1722 domain-containing protein [Acanthopleuribacter pedis]
MKSASNKPIIGISMCLLGTNVRHDGGNCANSFANKSLSEFFEWHPVCPEVGSGMSTPRPAMRLVQTESGIRLRESQSGKDRTEQLTTYCASLVQKLSTLPLQGFILKSKSPSCGLKRVMVYGEKGNKVAARNGLFTEALQQALPFLPIEEDGRLNDVTLREHFVERVYAYGRWTAFRANKPQPKHLVQFQQRHKMQLYAHDPRLAQKLGRLAGNHGESSFEDVLKNYEATFFECLSNPTKHGRHANVLHHLMGFLKNTLDSGDKQELLEQIEAYRLRHTPLAVPLMLLNHHLRRHPHPWVGSQTYLEPYPGALRHGQILVG